jgi:multiple sugar transport system ATP-binding protein
MTTVYVTHDQTEAMTLGDRVAVLREGQLEQVATPRELYRRPANLFVASAIGSPPMNLVPAAVDGCRLRLPFAEVELAEEAARRVGGRGLVVAGIRPEDLEEAGLAGAGRARGVAFRAGVDVVEWLGDVQYAYAPYTVTREVAARGGAVLRELEPEPLRAQLTVALDAASRVREGEAIELWLDPGRIHLFDVETGDSLAREN